MVGHTAQRCGMARRGMARRRGVGWLLPVRDVGCAQQRGQVGDRVAQGACLVALRLAGEEVEGDEGSVGAS